MASDVRGECDGGEDAVMVLDDHGQGNWIWLTEIEASRRALDLSGTLDVPAFSLARHFDEAYHLADSREACERARERHRQEGPDNLVIVCGRPLALPFAPSTFDCVAFHGPMTPSAEAIARVRAGHAVLRHGGCLQVVTGQARPKIGIDAVRHAVAAYRFRRGLQRLGFRAVVSYWVISSGKDLDNLLPMDSVAARGFELLQRDERLGLHVRLQAEWAALYRTLWGAQLHLAYK